MCDYVFQGMPAECDPGKLTGWQSFRSFIKWFLFWSEDPCQQYHKALLVDPFWEVTPMMVSITSSNVMFFNVSKILKLYYCLLYTLHFK